MEDVKNEQKKLKTKLGYIKQGNPRNRSEEQEKTISNTENLLSQEKRLLKCLIIMLGTCLEIFMIQNKKEQDLKY